MPRPKLYPEPRNYCQLSPVSKALLVVVVDTEEEFDWSSGFSRENTSVQSMRWIIRIQRIFEEYHIRPVYVVDYPIVSQSAGYKPLQEIYSSGGCLIGAHLHPWVNPPFEETVSAYNSFPGNLPLKLEASKLKLLGSLVEDRFGVRPTIYKAGRYGIGPNTADILDEQQYEVDLSVCPYMDYSTEGGPDFTLSSAWPYWFGNRDLLELPLTVGFSGLLRRWGRPLHSVAGRGLMALLHGPGVLARLGLVSKIHLSPEGYLAEELVTLVRALHRDGLRIFSFAFHSPSLDYGHTPYVRSNHELEDFFSRCRRFFDFFMTDLGGVPTTPLELKHQLAQPRIQIGE
jgi:hypothetical protein